MADPTVAALDRLSESVEALTRGLGLMLEVQAKHGAALERIEAAIGPVGQPVPHGSGPAPTLRSPGLLLSHYAPSLPVRPDAAEVRADEALLAFGTPLPGAGLVFQLSGRGDVAEAAARLFSGLRWLDAEGARLGLRGIAAMSVPAEGLGAAIRDRLARAAAPRG